jgi:leader peptidase (prepilin peptidase)/N-methyltransferase
VVIARMPKMLEREWRAECAEFLGTAPSVPSEAPKFNLCFPGSHCPHCKHAIAFYDNIPLFSYVWLKAKCRHCAAPISARYPLVEALTALLSVLVIVFFGLTFKGAAALVFVWALVALTFIDIDEQILPDQITLPMLWLGLALNYQDLFVSLHDAVLGAAIGYLSLWSLYWLFKFITKKEGMGYGDFKLLAMIGAWLGVQCLPLTLVVASFIGSIFGVAAIFLGKTERSAPISFGPFLALAALVSLFLGPKIMQYYLLHFVGF